MFIFLKNLRVLLMELRKRKVNLFQSTFFKLIVFKRSMIIFIILLLILLWLESRETSKRLKQLNECYAVLIEQEREIKELKTKLKI
jgi:hypothetical protein